VKKVRSGGAKLGLFHDISVCVGTEAGVVLAAGSDAHGVGLDADQFAYT
jgi:hypothetical protein